MELVDRDPHVGDACPDGSDGAIVVQGRVVDDRGSPEGVEHLAVEVDGVRVERHRLQVARLLAQRLGGFLRPWPSSILPRLSLQELPLLVHRQRPLQRWLLRVHRDDRADVVHHVG
eukprot:786727-Heterocapsa_arctica.AAC.1